jgi:ubiquinone/menaquinone biosynthesis C-methylase UbiE
MLGALFDALYWAGYWLYDPLTAIFFGPEWHRWRQTVLPLIPAGPVLEIGCGTGQLLPELQRKSGYAVGIDLSESMLAAARRRFSGSGLVRASGSQLPFGNQAFQAVVTTFPAGYIAGDDTLAEIARVLRPGGVFAAVVSARFDRFQYRRPLIHPILRIAYGSSRTMNRWPDDLLAHSALDGAWHDIPTPQGTAFVWVARKRV